MALLNAFEIINKNVDLLVYKSQLRLLARKNDNFGIESARESARLKGLS